MTKLRDIPSRLWAKVVWAVERADIVPLMVLVSTWHYAGALIGKDSPPVAVAIGILIDLGQYRSVREYFRGHTNGKLTVMVILTAMTGYYHWLWYSDVILAATMPATIICLALLSKWGGWDRQGNTITKPPETKPQQVAKQVEEITPQKETCVEKIETLLRENETARNWPAEQVAESVGCSATYVRREYKRNGQGWERKHGPQ